MNRSSFLLPAILLVFFTNSIAVAQQIKYFSQLRINNAVIGIENSVFTDALGSDGKIQHLASFDILVNENEATATVISAIQEAATPQGLTKSRELAAGAGLQLIFTSNITGVGVAEEKNYSGITLDEIKLPDLNAADQSNARISVKLKAATVTTLQAGGKSANTGSGRNNNVQVSHFRLTLGALPCVRVGKISSISVKPASAGLQNFTVEISGADAAPWNQWFSTGAGGIKKEQGKLEFLANDFKTEVLTIQLTGVEIVSYSFSNIGTASRATVVLRAVAAVVKKAAQ